ncbi:MAG: arginine repressor [Bacteroidaceae bacterium]|nr:arginine repressor [Bacteroidaceae bacterium]MBQ9642369.1 arginine repressor [Bacteroidaceae bacterium]
MNVRQIRLERIRAIILTQEVGSQQELAQLLAKEGYKLTQPMLSRDLKQLKVVKGVSQSGKSIYMLPDNPYYRRVREHRELVNATRTEVQSVHFSTQLAVVKCRPGYASALASDIDAAGFPEVIGTVAGDDTVFLALQEGADREALESKLKTVTKS